MSVMDIFRNVLGTPATPAPAPVAPPPTPGNIPATPNPTAATTDLTQQQSPLELNKDLWKSTPIDPKAPPRKESLFANVKPEDLLKAAQNVDFNAIIPLELSARIKAGGDDGLIASQQAQNLIAQNVYAQATMATTKIVDAALKEQKDLFKSELPGLIKQLNTRSTFLEENPALNDPVLNPLVTSIQKQLQVKNPNASTTELRTMTSDLLEAMAEKIVAQKSKNSPAPQTKAGARNVEDWDKFVS